MPIKRRLLVSFHVIALAVLCAAAADTRMPAQQRVDFPAAPNGQSGDELSNHAFQIRYDASGLRSLERTNDLHDTDYIAANGALGRLLVRYRTAPHGDWRELRGMIMRTQTAAARSVEYVLGTFTAPLASKVSPSAERGVGGLRALNDGLVPIAPSADGRGRIDPAGAALPAPVPTFAWTTEPNEPGSGGPGTVASTRWVQYTLPTEDEVRRIEVFWLNAPQRWRLLYQADRQWKEVSAPAGYGIDVNKFTVVEFAPVKTIALRIEVVMPPRGTVSLAEWRVGPEPQLVPSTDLAVTQRFTLEGDALDWTLTLANRTTRPLEVGDLGIPLEFAERVAPPADIYTKKLIRHSFVAGHGSWVYWQRSSGQGPYLLMIPGRGTKFEYFDSSGGGTATRFGAFTPYVHAKAATGAAIASGGDWRLPATSLTLKPTESVTYSFRFLWVDDFAGVRQALFENGRFDVVVAPGMVVPADLTALVALRSRNAIAAVAPEHPAQTNVQ